MKMFIAGHGHRIDKDRKFTKWCAKHHCGFLISFFNIDNPRLDWVRESNRREHERKSNKGSA